MAAKKTADALSEQRTGYDAGRSRCDRPEQARSPRALGRLGHGLRLRGLRWLLGLRLEGARRLRRGRRSPTPRIRVADKAGFPCRCLKQCVLELQHTLHEEIRRVRLAAHRFGYKRLGFGVLGPGLRLRK